MPNPLNDLGHGSGVPGPGRLRLAKIESPCAALRLPAAESVAVQRTHALHLVTAEANQDIFTMPNRPYFRMSY
jgi:hypothetical protein